jgi:hypothetical protein
MSDEQRIFEAQGFLILTSTRRCQVGDVIGTAGEGIGQVRIIGEATEAELEAQASKLGMRSTPTAGHFYYEVVAE